MRRLKVEDGWRRLKIEEGWKDRRSMKDGRIEGR